MTTFLIQTDNGEVVHDFCFTLIQAIKYQNWYRNTEVYRYILSLDNTPIPDCIPVGSVEFVHNYFKEYNITIPNPLNIPPDLHIQKFLKRDVYYGWKADILRKSFVKSVEKVKGFTAIVNCNKEEIETIPDEYLLISAYVDIESEWRAFVYNRKLVGIQNYSGEFTKFPNIDFINSMIDTFQKQPPAYTLDIGITQSDVNMLIECHNFYSCGFYGFSDSRIIPQMFIDWYKWYVKLISLN
jgi:hypothetical protein